MVECNPHRGSNRCHIRVCDTGDSTAPVTRPSPDSLSLPSCLSLSPCLPFSPSLPSVSLSLSLYRAFYRAFCAVEACFEGVWGVASCTLATPESSRRSGGGRCWAWRRPRPGMTTFSTNARARARPAHKAAICGARAGDAGRAPGERRELDIFDCHQISNRELK